MSYVRLLDIDGNVLVELGPYESVRYWGPNTMDEDPHSATSPGSQIIADDGVIVAENDGVNPGLSAGGKDWDNAVGFAIEERSLAAELRAAGSDFLLYDTPMPDLDAEHKRDLLAHVDAADKELANVVALIGELRETKRYPDLEEIAETLDAACDRWDTAKQLIDGDPWSPPHSPECRGIGAGASTRDLKRCERCRLDNQAYR